MTDRQSCTLDVLAGDCVLSDRFVPPIFCRGFLEASTGCNTARKMPRVRGIAHISLLPKARWRVFSSPAIPIRYRRLAASLPVSTKEIHSFPSTAAPPAQKPYDLRGKRYGVPVISPCNYRAVITL